MMNKLRGSWLICPRRLQLHILQTGGHSGGAEIHIPGQGPGLRQPQPGLGGEQAGPDDLLSVLSVLSPHRPRHRVLPHQGGYNLDLPCHD